MPAHLRLFVSLVVLGVTGACTPRIEPAGPDIVSAMVAVDTFLMPDGAQLPYKTWMPPEAPRLIVLGLHGFGDTANNAFQRAAPLFTAAGIGFYAYDQRGFGAAPHHGIWAGTETLTRDATAVARLLRARHPGTPLIIMGESMGAAVAITAAAGAEPPEADGYILVAPAVQGRASMSWLTRSVLDLAARTIPLMQFQNSGAGIVPTDDDDTMRAWGRDPLTLKEIRVDAIVGLVNLMDAATAAAPHFHARSLVLYGARDQIIDPGPVRSLLHALPEGADHRAAYYADGYHMLLRDRRRSLVIDDLLAWIADPAAPLPSGAEAAAAAWLAKPGK
jgi:alpha-beta hydrolase superfamily lysophospholipase